LKPLVAVEDQSISDLKRVKSHNSDFGSFFICCFAQHAIKVMQIYMYYVVGYLVSLRAKLVVDRRVVNN